MSDGSFGNSVRSNFFPILSSAHRRLEPELLRHSACVPLQHRTVWLEHFGTRDGLFCAAENARGECSAGVTISIVKSRVLPGHKLLRIERFCAPEESSVARKMIEALAEWVRKDQRVLRLSVETCCLDETRREITDELLAKAGFVRCKEARNYEHTLVLDLQPDEEALWAGLHPNGRRKVRMIAKHPVELRTVEDPVWAPRVEALMNESMSRTGGYAARQDWMARIRFGREWPNLMRTTGLFRTDITGPDSLLAFACGFNHGQYVHYDAAGATRFTDLRIPLGYAIMWDLIRWAKANSAQQFDFGGITFGHQKDGEDALGGISDFKRAFSRNAMHVGSEWVLEPHPLRARVAQALGAGVQRLRSSLRRG